MRFSGSLDPTAKMVTGGVTLLFAIIIAVQIHEIRQQYAALSMIIIGVLCLIYVTTLFLRPISYHINENNITIRRLVASREIIRTDIESARLLLPKELNGSIRTFGVGGLFGYFGRFYHPAIGSMRWYVTNRKNAVLIRTRSGNQYVLSPDDTTGFLKALSV